MLRAGWSCWCVLALSCTEPGSGGATESPGDSGLDAPATTLLEGACPTGFSPAVGQNDGFPSGGVGRRFHALAPEAPSEGVPVFVSLTGTVQSELDFARQAALDQLPAAGWLVLAPVRTCSQNGTNCAQLGSDGRIWEPWFDGTTGGPTDDEGPDVRFIEEMVRCAATTWSIDARRIFVGGISAGGSFTNRALTFDSDFFAGGVSASGNWYAGNAAPRTPIAMSPSIVVLVWGGPTDVWPPQNPLANYDPETRLAAQHYAAQPDVVTVSCSGTHGHIWPTAMTSYFTKVLLSHPKGSAVSDFVLPSPPSGFSCVLGEYVDH